MASSSINCINLCDQTDCDWWQEQSVCLIENHGMKNVFLDVRLTSTKENGDSKRKADKTFVEPKKSDALVILIYSSWMLITNTPPTTSYKLAGQMEPIHKLTVVS